MTIYSYCLILLRRRSRRRGRYSSDHRPIFALLFGTCLFIYIHSHIGIEYANGGCWWENVSEMNQIKKVQPDMHKCAVRNVGFCVGTSFCVS